MTSAAGSRWKFGEVISGEDKKFTYPNMWAQQTMIGPDRLVIAPREGHVDLLVDLLEAINPPFGLLYVLVVPRGGGIPGRYQSPQPLNSNQVLPFLSRFRHFLEEDGRHSLWIAGAFSPSSMLVYDRHNLIYAYGPLEHYKAILARHAFEESVSIPIPAPHVHRYHESYDSNEAELLHYCDWSFTELRDSDDE